MTRKTILRISIQKIHPISDEALFQPPLTPSTAINQWGGSGTGWYLPFFDGDGQYSILQRRMQLTGLRPLQDGMLMIHAVISTLTIHTQTETQD